MIYDIKPGDATYQANAAANALTFTGNADHINLAEGAKITSTGTGNGVAGLGTGIATMHLDGMVMSSSARAIATGRREGRYMAGSWVPCRRMWNS